jgi:hypothetical protein
MKVRLVLAMLVSSVLWACGDEPPPEADGDADADADADADVDGDADTDADADVDGDTDGDADGDANYFPISPGTSWDYDEVSPGGFERTLHKEITACESITFDDCATGDPTPSPSRPRCGTRRARRTPTRTASRTSRSRRPA